MQKLYILGVLLSAFVLNVSAPAQGISTHGKVKDTRSPVVDPEQDASVVLYDVDTASTQTISIETLASCRPCNCSEIPGVGLQVDCRRLSLVTITNISLPRNTTVLLLGQNNFKQVLDDEFAKFPNLAELDLSLNSIHTLHNESFVNLKNLKHLSLENNSLTFDAIPEDVFSGLTQLQTLRLNNNSLKAYPDKALSKLKSLEHLYIDGLSDEEFGTGFSEMTMLVHLTLSPSCNMYVLKNSTFVNLGNLRSLDISHCKIFDIEPEAFAPLLYLHTLNISSNYKLGLKNFSRGMYGISPGLHVLKANNIVRFYKSCVILNKEHFVHLSNTSITHLELDNNNIENILPGVLPLFPPNLTVLSAKKSKLSYGHYLRELHYLTNLQQVDLSGEPFDMNIPEEYSLEEMYDDCDTCIGEDAFADNTHYVEPSFHHSIKRTNKEHFNLTLPPKLVALSSNFTQMTFTFGFIYVAKTTLRYLDLSSNLIQFSGEVKGLGSVTHLDLSNNLARNMDKTLLWNMVGLKTVDLSFNFFGSQIGRDVNGTMFGNLSHLENLTIAFNGMLTMRGNVISNLTELKVLNVSYNGLFNFSPNMKKLTRLKVIDCTGNQIKWLSEKTMNQITKLKQTSRNLTLLLGSNPLSCDCNGLDTLTWLYHSGVTPDNMRGYYCLLKKVKHNITNMEDFFDTIDKVRNNCRNNFGIALGTTVIFIACLCVVVGAVLYRYRWKLRYLYYAARLRYLDRYPPVEDEEEFIFDAFVSYADEDRGFVIEDMRARLEHESNMSLNIHHRDFMPGEPIVSNIVGAIKKSRKTLVLLSKNFLKSYWCTLELRMAQLESISSGRDIIVIIMYEQVPAKMIPPDFLHLLQSDSYIEYPQDDQADKEVFWEHLRSAVKHRTQRRSLSSIS